MEWRILTAEEMNEMYDRELGRDFPENELRPRAAAVELVRRGLYRPWAVFDPAPGAAGPAPMSRLCAYLFVAENGPGPVLLDYFAVLPAWRAKGLGAGLLAQLSAREGRAVLIESELPTRAPDPEMARRRIGFYRRCGALLTPYWDRAFQGLFRLLVLPAPASSARPEEAGPALAGIYRALLPGEHFARDFDWGRVETDFPDEA